MHNHTEISIRPNKMIRMLTIIIVVLILASLAGQIIKYTTGHNFVFGFVTRFNLDEEGNIPTYFNSILLLFSFSLLLLIAILKKRAAEQYILHWFSLSFIFLYMSIDESAILHELVINPLRSLFQTKGIFYFAWVILGIFLLIIFALFYLKFFFKLPQKIRKIFFMAGFLYIGGALGGELIGGYYSSHIGEDNIIYSIITTIEEGMEMTGLVVFISGLFKIISDQFSKILIYVKEK